MSDLSVSSAPRGRRLPHLLASPWTITITVPLLVALFDPGQSAGFIRFAASTFSGTLPYIAFAVVLLAWLKAASADTLVAEAFKGRETRMIVFAALLGGLAPFCSCEVIPFIAGLLKLGAPLSAVMAFWLSSPLIDPPSLAITAAALGWNFALGKAVAAVALGLAGGFAMRALVKGGAFTSPLKVQKTKSCCGSSCASPDTDKPSVRWWFWNEPARVTDFREVALENTLFLVKWMALAYVLEAILVTYVPAQLIAGAVGGDGILPVIIAALVGMPAYLNSYVAPAMLAGLTEQGMTAGAAMAFMVAGAVSSIPAMAAVWSLVRAPVFAAYLGLGVTGAILSGLVFQMTA